jgi:hypothetical protein
MQERCSHVKMISGAVSAPLLAMSANSPVLRNFARSCLLLLALMAVLPLHANDAEKSALKLVPDQEKEGYEFRSESWTNDLEPTMGRAVRLQLFKGNEYAFCIAVPRDSGVHVTAAVLDFEGKPAGEMLPVSDGWGLVLFFKPKKTGTYAVAIRQTPQGKAKRVPCAMVTGWK